MPIADIKPYKPQIEKMVAKFKELYPHAHPFSLNHARGACEDYFGYRKLLDEHPTGHQIKSELDRLSRSANNFMIALKGLSDYTRSCLVEPYTASWIAPDLLEELEEATIFDEHDLRDIYHTAKRIRDLADIWREEIFVPRKQPQKHRRAFIRVMATVYEDVTGSPAKEGVHCTSLREEGEFGGAFFRLIYDCLVAGDETPQSERSLYDDIQKVLAVRNR